MPASGKITPLQCLLVICIRIIPPLLLAANVLVRSAKPKRIAVV